MALEKKVHDLRRLFWSRGYRLPNLNIPEEETSWYKTILEEGDAADLAQLNWERLSNLLPKLSLELQVVGLWELFRLEKEEKRLSATKVITEQHRAVLAVATTTLAEHGFFLAGGTALAEGYLSHRKSFDLDFFIAKPCHEQGFFQQFAKACAAAGFELHYNQNHKFADFIRCWAGDIRIEIANRPYPLLGPSPKSIEGFPIASLRDLAADKVLALWQRGNTRDFVDVYFLTHEFSPDELENLAGSKDQRFIDRYGWALALAKGTGINPADVEMLRPLDFGYLRTFFRDYALRVLKTCEEQK